MRRSRKESDPFIASMADIARIFGQQAAEREEYRLDVFNKAFAVAKTEEQRVALAVAYLGGGK